MSETLETTTSIPEWFVRALGATPRHADLQVADARIHYRSWGTIGRRNIVLVHGGAAHSGWWDHIAPFLTTDGMVVALDLVGHGDSDHRADYGISSWADDVLAVAHEVGFDDGFTLIGHSLGGLITAHLAQRVGAPVGEAIVIDSPVGRGGRRTPVESNGLVPARRRTYSSAAEMTARFRPVPHQSALPYITAHIAEHSVRETAGEWSWKFDSHILSGDVTEAQFALVHCPVAFFRAENGLVSDSARAGIEASGALFIEIPEAGHAPMLDQPIALVTGIRTVFAAWDAARRA